MNASFKLNMSPFDKDDVDNMLKYFECSLCLGVLKDAVVCEMGHFFCNTCLIKYMRTSKNCPKNKYHLLDEKNVKRAKHIDEIIDLQTVNCKHNKEGCFWRGKLRFLAIHLKSECKYAARSGLSHEERKRGESDDDLILNENELLTEKKKGKVESTNKYIEDESDNEETVGSLKQDEVADMGENMDKAVEGVDDIFRDISGEDGFILEFARKLKQLTVEDVDKKSLSVNFSKLKEFMFNKFDELHGHLDKQEAALDRQNRLVDDNKNTKRIIPCLLKHESIDYRNRSIEMNVLAEKKANMIVLDIPTTAGSFSIEMQMFCKIRKGWIAVGVCDANVAKSHECEFHKNNFKGYAIFTTNGYCFNGFENSAYQVEFQRNINYRTILRLGYESKTKTVTLFFRDQEIEMEVNTDTVLYPVVMFFGDSSRMMIIN